jgi:hypothetical protein
VIVLSTENQDAQSRFDGGQLASAKNCQQGYQHSPELF